MQLCQNCRTISLISHPSSHVHDQLKQTSATSGTVYAEEQPGFRAGKSITEQIINLQVPATGSNFSTLSVFDINLASFARSYRVTDEAFIAKPRCGPSYAFLINIFSALKGPNLFILI